MIRLYRAAALTAVGMLSACAEPVTPVGVPPEDIVLAPPTGALIEGAYYDVIAVDGRLVPDGSGPGFRLQGGRIKGGDGCHALAGPVVQTPTTLKIGPLEPPVSASATCSDRVAGPAAALRRALAEVDSARIGPGGTVALTAAGRDRVIAQQQRP